MVADTSLNGIFQHDLCTLLVWVRRNGLLKATFLYEGFILFTGSHSFKENHLFLLHSKDVAPERALKSFLLQTPELADKGNEAKERKGMFSRLPISS